MNKVLYAVPIMLSEVQMLIAEGLRKGKIDIKKDTLRGIGKKIGIKNPQAQSIKCAINRLVELGIVQKVYGEFEYWKENEDVTITVTIKREK